MAGEEDVRNFPTLVIRRAGIDGRSEEIVLERVGECALLVADSSGDEAHHSVGDDSRRQFTTGEDVIADGNLARNQMLAYPIVDSLVMPAKDDDIVEQRHTVGYLLVECLPIGRGIDDFVVFALALQRGDGAVDGFDLHHHARLAPERVVVHAPPFVGRVVAQVVEMDFYQALVLCSLQDGAIHHSVDHFRKYRQDVYSHVCL